MAKLFSLSEAATISIHAMIIIGRSDIQLNVQQLTERTEASRHHLAKVLQRLAKAGFISSSRGPSGGYIMKKSAEEISLLDIYEAIEGKIEVSSCSLKLQICPKDKCIVNNLVNKVTIDFVNYFKNQTLKNYL